MSKSDKCRSCKRAIGKLAEQTGGFCPRCLKDDPKMIDPPEKEDNNNEQT